MANTLLLSPSTLQGWTVFDLQTPAAQPAGASGRTAAWPPASASDASLQSLAGDPLLLRLLRDAQAGTIDEKLWAAEVLASGLVSQEAVNSAPAEERRRHGHRALAAARAKADALLDAAADEAAAAGGAGSPRARLAATTAASAASSALRCGWNDQQRHAAAVSPPRGGASAAPGGASARLSLSPVRRGAPPRCAAGGDRAGEEAVSEALRRVRVASATATTALQAGWLARRARRDCLV